MFVILNNPCTVHYYSACCFDCPADSVSGIGSLADITLSAMIEVCASMFSFFNYCRLWSMFYLFKSYCACICVVIVIVIIPC